MTIAVIALIYGVEAIQLKAAPQDPVPVPWAVRVPSNGHIASEEKSHVVTQAAGEVKNWAYKSLAQAAPQDPVPVPWTPRNHAANWAVNTGGEVAPVSQQASGEVANWSYKSLAQNDPAPAPAIPYVPRAPKGADAGTTEQVGKEAGAWTYRTDPDTHNYTSPLNDVSTYESINDANLSGKPGLVLKQNGADNTRSGSNRFEGNPEYNSDYQYKFARDLASADTVNPKYNNAQISEPNPVPINGGSDYEKYNNANLSGRPSEVLKQNGAADVRSTSNRFEGNPEYNSAYQYKWARDLASADTIHPKYTNAQISEPNPVPINGGSEYEKYNDANLSGKPGLVLKQNGAADVRSTSNRFEGNPEYNSAYQYKWARDLASADTIHPKYTNAQISEPNPVPINGGSDYEKYNDANLSGKPGLVLKQNGADDVRSASNRFEGNPEYNSAYQYKWARDLASADTIHPKYTN